MQTTILGRTGLRTTIAGLGSGGFSRIGIAKYGEEHAAGIVRAAYDAGVTFFDTSKAYGTEAAVGQGLKGVARDSFILSTKYPYKAADGSMLPVEALERGLDDSLKALGMDYVDIYHVHGVAAADYPWVRDELVPELHRMRDKGKIRFLGITEGFASDTAHETLKLALADDFYDVIMAGYNLLNPSAAQTLLPKAIQNNVAVLCMFAVRSALSNPEQLKVDLGRILAAGQGGEDLRNDGHTLDFLTAPGVANTIMEAAYRFCRHTPGISVTLTGTGNKDHLLDNLRSIEGPPLPQQVLDRLDGLFGGVDCVSGQ